MDLSGVIFVVLAVAWAGYLIPKALRHHDEVARTRSIDKFSTAMRVLAHREPVSGGEAQLVVAPGRARSHPAPMRPAKRKATAVATRRRRRLLLLLLIADLAVGALAYYGYLRRWTPVIPGGLTVGWLLLCRFQVRRLARRTTRRSVAPVSVEPVQLNGQGFVEVSDDEDTASIPVEELRAAMAGGDGLWDPLPVTLPTYVTKPAAKRTVRTIDLTAPDVWSSGPSEQDSALVAQATAERHQAEDEVGRAVGS